MDDWDLYALNNKLEAIKNQEERIADSLDRAERPPKPGLRLLSDKTRWKIIVGIIAGFFGLSTVGFFGLMLLSFFI